MGTKLVPALTTVVIADFEEKFFKENSQKAAIVVTIYWRCADILAPQ